jgi:hypothetical protein
MNYFLNIANPFLIQSQNTLLLEIYVLIFMSKSERNEFTEKRVIENKMVENMKCRSEVRIIYFSLQSNFNSFFHQADCEWRMETEEIWKQREMKMSVCVCVYEWVSVCEWVSE